MIKSFIYFSCLGCVILGATGCSDEEVPSPSQVIDNILVVPDSAFVSRPTETEIYIGHFMGGECNLALQTYVSVETLSSASGNPLTVLDGEGNEAEEGRCLLPPVSYLPFQDEWGDPTLSASLQTEYHTHFTVRLVGQENETYFFRVKLYQPGTGKEYVTRKYALSSYTYQGSRDTIFYWHVNCELFEEIPRDSVAKARLSLEKLPDVG